MRRILLISAAMLFAIVLLEAVGSAQCRPGYTGSGYYRSSNCGEYLIPKADPFGAGFYSAPMIFPGPYGYGYAQPVVVAPPWAYRPWYFEPPAPYVQPTPAPPASVRPQGMYRYPAHRSLETQRPNQITLGGDGVWTNY